MRFTVSNSVTPVFPQGNQAALLLRNDGPGTVYIDSVSSVNMLNSYPLPARSSIVWKAGTPLFCVSETNSVLRAVINQDLADDAGYGYSFLADVTSGFTSTTPSSFVEVGSFSSIRLNFKYPLIGALPDLFFLQWVDQLEDATAGRLFETGIGEESFSLKAVELYNMVDIPVKARYVRFVRATGIPAGVFSTTAMPEKVLLYGTTKQVSEITYARSGEVTDGLSDWGFLREGDFWSASTAKTNGLGFTLPMILGATSLTPDLKPGRYTISIRCNAVTTTGNLVVRAGWNAYSTIGQVPIPTVTGYTTYVGEIVVPAGVSPVMLDWAPVPVTTGVVTVSIYPSYY